MKTFFLALALLLSPSLAQADTFVSTDTFGNPVRVTVFTTGQTVVEPLVGGYVNQFSGGFYGGSINGYGYGMPISRYGASFAFTSSPNVIVTGGGGVSVGMGGFGFNRVVPFRTGLGFRRNVLVFP